MRPKVSWPSAPSSHAVPGLFSPARNRLWLASGPWPFLGHRGLLTRFGKAPGDPALPSFPAFSWFSEATLSSNHVAASVEIASIIHGSSIFVYCCSSASERGMKGRIQCRWLCGVAFSVSSSLLSALLQSPPTWDHLKNTL